MTSSVRVQATVALARQYAGARGLDEAGFAEFVAARPGARPAHAEDLLLVYRWSKGDLAAITDLEARYLRQLPLVLASTEATADFVADVAQELRTKLFAEKRLLQYAGTGPLGGWLRRAALNTASVLQRPERREAPVDPTSEELVPDAELTFLRERYRDDFRACFVDALKDLSTRERTVLRLNSLSDVSIDELGVMYGVHRATAARWVQRARDQVIASTRARLVERLKLDGSELDELIALMRNQLDVSLVRYLR